MKIKIGKASYATNRPNGLEQQLIAASGLSAAETAQLLRGHQQAHHVARALRPLLGDKAPEMVVMDRDIAEHGVNEIAAKVDALLDSGARSERDNTARKDDDESHTYQHPSWGERR